MSENLVDIKENYIRDIDDELLYYLLKDHSTGFNIIWATDNYADRGEGYQFKDQIKAGAITGKNGAVIRPRVRKSKAEQADRVKKKAEVFTPAWVCNAQNNLIDSAWFGRDDVFNYEIDNGWITRKGTVKFYKKDKKTWQQYVEDVRLEVSCGEAPYLTNRYDAVSGEIVKPKERIGMLDRKLRIITENAKDDSVWYEYAKIAFQSVYGFEWQGDSLLIARENLLFAFIDFYKEVFKEEPSKKMLREIAEIISWNIWQMDGIKCVVPDTCHTELKDEDQFSLFSKPLEEVECPGCKNHNVMAHNGIYALIKDWKKNEVIRFADVLEGEKNGKI